ncbi:hypothetical protein DP145_11645 [Clostridium tetani]|uniref:amidase domain-containing protein n=1 Tax=Clostridium tetani TaxID=1513 RepID=UPI00100BB4A6|nr:amidase domain-containing protein [Clostridium tetani]RXI44924.1 hypothetical protein DP126_10045 [Clostridium tetani]RXM60216.1 hypothetical protein DP138_09415 [Clostridium tetani]RXM65097.1 hypothetical protein DP145_11645 [Clostridium tetani]
MKKKLMKLKSKLDYGSLKNAYIIKGDEITNEDINALIDNYFNWIYENLINNTIGELQNIVGNNKLAEFKKSKLKWLINWYGKKDEEIKDYKIYTEINDVDINGNIIYINVIYGEDLILKSSSDIVQKIRNQEHKILAKNVGSKLVIIHDYYNDELADEMFLVSDREFKTNKKVKSINKKLEKKTLEINKNIKKIDKLVKQYKRNLHNTLQINNIQERKYPGYDGIAAAKYAVKYAINYNPEYQDYNGRGGDCTNFISQCIYAGGIPTDNVWYKDSHAWIRVVELRSWLLKKGYARELTVQDNAKEGDLIQLRNSGGYWYHSLIVTYKNPTNGEPFVSCHTGDYVNRALSTYTTDRRYLILTS